MKDNNRLTFSYLYQQINKKDNLEIARSIKLLFELAAAFLGSPEGAGLYAFVKFMGESDAIESGVQILNKLKGGHDNSYKDRALLMQETYAAICFTAFFDTLKSKLPKEIRDKISLSEKEKHNLAQKTVNPEKVKKDLDRELVMPDLAFNCEKVYPFLRALYIQMSESVQHFVSKLAFSEEENEAEIITYNAVMNNLPEDAMNCFRDQYLVLCGTCNEFAVYIQLGKEHENAVILEGKFKELQQMNMHISEKQEYNLNELKKAINEAPIQIKRQSVSCIINKLLESNQELLEKAVVETMEDEELIFPPLEQAFIAQRYRLISYTGQERLEQNHIWEENSAKNDMDAFWTKFMLTPESTERLLLILGEPGSGKSLLTKVLTARLSSANNVVVRIPLRTQMMEDSIDRIVCNQIQVDGDASEPVPSFKWIAEEFSGTPITLIFDGFDEVQQATGLAYQRFLTDLKGFQTTCFENDRAVRIVITSRRTLIDKAQIPNGTLVMKLEEFDDTQKSQWISVWNKYNHDRLLDSGLADFKLPEGNREIDELSKQPLLLMMLAIYDADFENRINALMQTSIPERKLKRTQLYHEILLRFIRRELKKGRRGSDWYDDAKPEEQANMVEEEMKKLGIAALGMFVREKLSITVEELEKDFAYLQVKQPDFGERDRQKLQNGEIFLGSFFFIHDSRDRSKDEQNENREDMLTGKASFVFLHKTFYEFLVADYVLQNFFTYVLELYDIKRFKEEKYRRDLKNLEEPFIPCFVSLNGACLCTEPEILQMMAEWKDDKVTLVRGADAIDMEGIHTVIREVFSQHFALIRDGQFPAKAALIDGRTMPQLDAVYLLNMVTLQTLICRYFQLVSDEWRFCSRYIMLNLPLPKSLKREEDEEKRNYSVDPSEEIPLKFMALFMIRCNENTVFIGRREKTVEFEGKRLLDARLELLSFLQDDTGYLLYALHNHEISFGKRQKYLKKLNEQGMGLDVERVIGRLLELIEKEHVSSKDIYYCLHQLPLINRDSNYLTIWLLLFHQLVCDPWDRKMLVYDRDSMTYHTIEDYNDLFVDFYIRSSSEDKERYFSMWLKIVETLGVTESLFTFIRTDRYLSLPGPCFYEIMKVLQVQEDAFLRYNNVSHENFTRSISVQSDLFSSGYSPKWIAAYLILLRKIAGSEKSLWILKKNKCRILDSFRNIENYETLAELPALMRECIRIGATDQVKQFIRTFRFPYDISSRISKKNDQLLLEMLEIEKIVGEETITRNLLESIPIQMWNRENISLILRLLHRNICFDDLSSTVFDSIKAFLQAYSKILPDAQIEAISLLILLAGRNNERGAEWYISDDMYRALKCSLLSYPVVLEEDFSLAADLLICSLKMNVIQGKDYVKAFLECLNYALGAGNKSVESPLIRLFDALPPETQRNVKRSLSLKMPYIQNVFPNLFHHIRIAYGSMPK